jgi:hypothetical protein
MAATAKPQALVAVGADHQALDLLVLAAAMARQHHRAATARISG